MSEHDRKMLEVATRNGVTIEISDVLSGAKQTWGPGERIEGDPTFKPVAPTNSTAEIAESGKPQRPAHIPEKFWDAEKGVVRVDEMARSYVELESGKGKPQIAQPGQPQSQSPAKPAAPAKSAVEAAADAVRAAQAELAAATTDEAKAAAQTKLDAARAAVVDAALKPTQEVQQVAATPAAQEVIAKAAEDFAQNQQLGEESLKALEAIGISRNYANAYVEGLKAQAELVSMKIYGEVGGKDEYAKMAEWAQANWSADQIAAFNTAVTSGNLEATVGAVKNLAAVYNAAQGTQGKHVEGNSNDNKTAVVGYQSQDEMNKDMRDPRYTKGDPAFHAEVDRKIAAAIKNGVNLGVNVRMGEFVF